MRAAVRDVWCAFCSHFEGTVPTLYADVRNLVTVGRGHLCDPVDLAIPLPFSRISDGTPATDVEIRQEWERVKSGGFADLGWRAAARAATLALSPADVDALTLSQLEANDIVLASRLHGGRWEDLPASAQCALHSWAWAAGPRAVAPRLWAAVEAGDWTSAAAEVHLADAGNPGLTPRNAANRTLLLASETADPDVVAWP